MPIDFEEIQATDEVCMKHHRAEPCPDCLVDQIVQLRLERDDIQALLNVTSQRLDTFITALSEAQARYVRAETDLKHVLADNDRMRAIIAELEKGHV
jgi:regulator of protease activity HflC (stomatin/prohibitin superfamily)